MTQDRRHYWRAYYLANKAAWRGKRWNRTPEQRAAYNQRMRDYRAANARAIKVGRALGVPLAEARLLVEVANRRTKTCESHSAGAPASSRTSTAGTRT